MKINPFLKKLLLICLLYPSLLQAQNRIATVATAPDRLTLQECIDYALQNRAAVEQAVLDEAKGERNIKAELAGWLPQVAVGYSGVKNLKLQQQPFGDQVITLGRNYTSSVLLQANQTLFSSQLLLASKAARFTRQQLDLNTINTKINTVVIVSKAFYDVLLTLEQVRILDLNLVRQEKQYKDARSRFEVGLVDKTDYQRAAITLANIRSDRNRAKQAVSAKQAFLKQVMGLPVESEVELAYDYDVMQQAVLIDTAEIVDFANRVELQQLQAQQQLLRLNTSFQKWSILPTASAFVNYNSLYFNNELSALYNNAFPTSAVGLQLSLPLFQGGRRYQNLRAAQLEEQRAEVEVKNTRNVINTEYQTALANYKSDYYEWVTLRDNLKVAQEVYDIIQLQYEEGVKAYIELVVAETELRATQLNYYNALYNVLSSKLDYQRALGNIDINR